MEFTGYRQNSLEHNISSNRNIYTNELYENSLTQMNNGFIRFEERKEQYFWAHPDEICFVKSADHYVKSLIKCGNQLKWMIRHSTLKELFNALPEANFIRLNRFYLLNKNYFLQINEREKLLYTTDNYTIAIPHRISPFVSDLLKSTVREMHFTK